MDVPWLASQAGSGRADGASSRSAPEGSLLHRVEVLEEALEASLVAQEALITQMQAQAAAVKAAQEANEAALRGAQARTAALEAAVGAQQKGCCCVM
ncbi:hypothetical protein TSOC_013010 [Tetrabaena socialis]|uniref:Uncharacterized protein n=1 Tax=Tetrabaena socialis TaxID=47790 RepID=A0A2J7ZLH1_9CHLO|nr:hypothetical protein TSOC_013010 [Tetrabaena socialis]|eukprot:PNH01118.1 hypothetical protein TSOC_013010 [Tetrabaena socialis]